MASGLVVYDHEGNVVLDTNDRCLKILGSFVIPKSDNDGFVYTAVHPEINQGTFFYYAQGNCFTLSGYYFSAPVAVYTFNHTITGDTLTMNCAYADVVKNRWNNTQINSVDVRVFYGVY